MEKTMLFIFNPKSGKGSIKNKLLDIIDIFIKGGYEVRVHCTQCSGDGREVAKRDGGKYNMIVCSGGDGTLDEVVSGMMEGGHSLNLGYIPAGSTNDFANSLHIPKNMIKAANNIVEGYFFPFDIGKFNDDTFVYIAAFGLFTDVSYKTDQDLKNILGHVAYVLEGMQRLFNIRSYQMRVESGDRAFEGDFIFGMVTNSTSVGGFKHLTGRNVQMDDGLFEATFIRRPKNPIEMQEIISSLLLAEDNTELIESFKTDHLNISCEELVSWTLDGEFGGESSTVEIKNVKQAARIAINPLEDRQQIEG